MAIFLSKRLLRLVLFVGACLCVVLFMTSSEGSTSDAAASTASYFGAIKDWGADIATTFGGPQRDTLSEKEKEAEEQRQKAEEDLMNPHDPVDEPTIDDNAQALLDSANENAAANGPQLDKTTWESMAASYANKGQKPKAAFVVLVRNSELYDILPSIKLVEDRFNKKFHYPWVFFNEEEFTEDFKTKIKEAISTTAEFGLIPKEQWSYPDEIDQEKARKERNKMAADGVIYASSESYRHMCRFQSGFFWRQKLLDDYDWYWRVEPGTKLYCDIDYDVFQYMQDQEKVYGFTISIHEYLRTIESLWDTTKKFIKQNPSYVEKDNLVDFISDDGGKTYNLCHFWSNFEIANLNFWRSAAYRDYFDYLDKTGNFFYERWGDAPVHSIAASLFLSKDKIHYFHDIGYHHVPYDNCPLDNSVFIKNKCDCDQENDFTFRPYACGLQYYNAQGLKKPEGWEKYHV